MTANPDITQKMDSFRMATTHEARWNDGSLRFAMKHAPSNEYFSIAALEAGLGESPSD